MENRLLFYAQLGTIKNVYKKFHTNPFEHIPIDVPRAEKKSKLLQ